MSESPFQAQELLAHLIHQDLHDIEAIVHVPTLQGSAKGKGKEKESEGTEEGQAIDSRAWLYESLRRLCQDLNTPWLPALQQSCTRQSCGEMKGRFVVISVESLAYHISRRGMALSLRCPCISNRGELVCLSDTYCVAHVFAQTECCAVCPSAVSSKSPLKSYVQIDYIEHTLNAATALLVSPKHFPSR